jgi:3-isopropylmalate/(R)-2-methylmalate dehydratase small subunit
MEPFTTLTAVAAPLLRDNVDTDAIIPSREMRTVSKKGLAAGLFSGWRYLAIGGREPDPGFVLNDPAFAGARILLAGENFGCGSSREHAVWALAEYGFRAIVAPSFNPIFRGNCIANGVVPVVLPGEVVGEIAANVEATPDHLLTIDLTRQAVIIASGKGYPFAIDADSRDALLAGRDPISRTLEQLAAISDFVERDKARRAWAYSGLSRRRAGPPDQAR